jgi:protein scribble
MRLVVVHVQGVFLTKINDEGPAAQAGLLVGDKLISVNGISLINCEHGDAVTALKNAGDYIEMIVVREILHTSDDHHHATNDNTMMKDGEKFSTVLRRDEQHDGQFGFSIAGGSQTTTTATTTSTPNEQDNLYISKVNNQEHRSIAIGDRLLAINGHDTGNLNHDQAIEMINDGGNNVELLLYREKLLTNGHCHAPSNHIDHTIEVRTTRTSVVFETNDKHCRRHVSPKAMDPWA